MTIVPGMTNRRPGVVPRRSRTQQIQTVGVMVLLEPHVKRLLDDMAEASVVPKWKIVTEALEQLARTVGPDGVPAALAVESNQPPLPHSQEVTAA